MNIIPLNKLELSGKRVLIRVDYNVPRDKEGRIVDDSRMRESLPTLRHILDHGGRAIIMTHLGRPNGVTDSLRLKPIADRLSELLSHPVRYVKDTIGPIARNATSELGNGDCLMLENLRFHDGETQNDVEFVRALAALGDVYVNDAFGTAHRKHASTEGVAHFLPVRAAGFLMLKELNYLSNALQHPKGRLVVILGGAKVSDKMKVTRRFIEIADSLVIGGGMAYTFLASQGEPVGKSLLEKDHLEFALEIFELASTLEKRIFLPIDHVIADSIHPVLGKREVDQIPECSMGLDIGSKTRRQFTEIIANAGTILWNGPMGVFETKAFSTGTSAIANTIATATSRGTVSIIGGGDTAAAVNALGLAASMSHISTGGGASLELLEGRTLPGLRGLEEN